MSTTASIQPELIPVRRTELRDNQRKLLRKVRGRTVLVIKGPSEDEDEKYIVDKEYFQELLKRFSSLVETLEIMGDRRLFQQILAVADTLEEDLRLGRLHSFEEAFEEA